MVRDNRAFAAAVTELRRVLTEFEAVAVAADADSWGTDIFRRLLGYVRSVRDDLNGPITRGTVGPAALKRLTSSGPNSPFSAGPTCGRAIRNTWRRWRTLRAVEEFRTTGRAQADAAPAT